MLSAGPIAFTAAADDLLAWAHYFFATLCRYSWVGLLLSLLLLPIYSLGTIISSGSAAVALGCAHFLSLLLLPIYLLGPIISLGHTADLLVWAHYFFGVCC